MRAPEILVYHRIGLPEADSQQFSVRPGRFDQHLARLMSERRVLSLSVLLNAAVRGEPLDNAVALTFDGGYADTLWNALPLLEKYGCPATVFVAPGLTALAGEDPSIGHAQDRLERMLLSGTSLPDALRLTCIDAAFSLDDAASCFAAFTTLADLLCQLTFGDRQILLADVRRGLGLPVTAAPYPLLSSAQVRELAASPYIEIGAHPHFYSPLRLLDAEAQSSEINQSKADLEQFLERPVSLFAYASDDEPDETARVRVAEAGFYGLTCGRQGLELPLDLTAIPRWPVGDWSSEQFAVWLDAENRHAVEDGWRADYTVRFGAHLRQARGEQPVALPSEETGMDCVTEGERPLRFMYLHNSYPEYIREVYRKQPDLAHLSSLEQSTIFRDSGYDATHIHVKELEAFGCKVEFLQSHVPSIRVAWAREQGLPTNMDESEYLLRRIAAFCPDVLYINNLNIFQAPFLAALQPRPPLVMGWHGSDMYTYSDWHGYDLLLTGLTDMFPHAEQLGVRHCRWFAPGAPEWVARQVAPLPQDIDIVFSGSLSPSQHVYRLNALSAVAELAAREGFSFAAHLMCNPEEMPDVLRPFLQPPVFGMDMQRALRRGRIVVDDRAWHGLWSTEGKSLDLGGEETVNMRLFEGTVGGSLVITPALKGLARYFEDGKEVVGYTDHDDMVAKIFYYLTHEEERQAIAEAGKARALRDHNLTVRARQLLEIVHEFL